MGEEGGEEGEEGEREEGEEGEERETDIREPLCINHHIRLIPREHFISTRFNFTNGHQLTKYTKLNPLRNIRRIWYVNFSLSMCYD